MDCQRQCQRWRLIFLAVTVLLACFCRCSARSTLLSGSSSVVIRRQLQVSLPHTTGSNASVSSPPLYLSPAFRYASLQASPIKSSINWASIVAGTANASDIPAVRDQGACASSWAFSSVASVSYGAAIGGSTTSLLSVQQLLDCTGGDNTCSMGWPYAALDYMVNASAQASGLDSDDYYPYTAMQGTCAATASASSGVVVSGYEQVDAHNWYSLLLALQTQPAVAFLYGSHPSFQLYNSSDIYSDPTCGANTTVDHSVLVIGYSLAGATPYWLIRNSWGDSWGTLGNMLMAITGGTGICNIHMVPPIYPVLNFPNPCTLNPCGAGTCSPSLSSPTSYTCSSCPSGYTAIAIPTFSSSSFPPSPSLASQQTCAPADTCATSAVLPCGIGNCNSAAGAGGGRGGIGGYTCTCPPGFASGLRADGSPICLPSTATTSDCAVYYPIGKNDTCTSISRLFNLTLSSLISLNAGLMCGFTQLINGARQFKDDSIYQSGKQLCVKAGSLTALPSCTSWFVPRGTDSCASIRSSYGLSPSDLYSLNPGLQCTNLYPSLVVQGGVATPRIGAPVCVSNINPFNPSRAGIGRLLYSASKCKSGSYLYGIQSGDYCSRIISKYCQGSTSAFQQSNNGWACTDSGLYQGQKVCVLTKP